MTTAKVISAAEVLLKAATDLVSALKDGGSAAAPVDTRSGNRTPAVTDYDGDDEIQNLVDCVRRAVRKSRQGVALTKKERNIMRRCVKDVKESADFDVINTNGHDVFTINGAGN